MLKTDVPESIEVAQHWTFEACRNAECYVTREDPKQELLRGPEGLHIYLAVEIPSGGGLYPTFGLTSFKGVTDIEVNWNPMYQEQDGDRYVISATESGGARHVLFDERVKYARVSVGCVSCQQARVDRRAAAEADAGI